MRLLLRLPVPFFVHSLPLASLALPARLMEVLAVLLSIPSALQFRRSLCERTMAVYLPGAVRPAAVGENTLTVV